MAEIWFKGKGLTGWQPATTEGALLLVSYLIVMIYLLQKLQNKMITSNFFLISIGILTLLLISMAIFKTET